MSRNKKKANVVSVDFTGVEAGGNLRKGAQILTVKEVEVRNSENSGNDYLNWKFGGKGGSVFHTTSLQPNALWNLRGLLEAMGLEVPEGPLDLDLGDYIDMEIGAVIEMEKYNGKNKPIIVDVFPEENIGDYADDAAEGGDDDDDDADGEEGDLTFEDVQGMSMDELTELAEEESVKLVKKHTKTVAKFRDWLCEKLDLEESTEEESDGEGEGDEPTFEEVQEMDKDELTELAEENEIKIVKKHTKTVAKFRDWLCEQLELEEDAGDDAGDDEGGLTQEDLDGMDKDELLQVAEDAEIKVPAKHKKTAKKLLAFLTEELALDDDDGEEESDFSKGDKVKFTDDGDKMKGKIKSINQDEGFAVVDVDGEDWEIELSDISAA